MKEYPQKKCTNCDKKETSWCVCKQCRKNAQIVKQLIKGTKKMDTWQRKATGKLKDYPYIDIRTVVKELKSMVKTKK